MGAKQYIVFVLAFLVATICASAQATWTVILNGKVTEDGKALPRAILILKKNGEEVQKLATAPNGKFSVVLEADNDYDLYFTKKGYVTKYISYSTKNVPADKVDGLYTEFIFELELFKEMEGLNTSILEFPVFKVRYYPGLKNLEYDKKHEAKIRSRLNTLFKDYEEAKKKAKGIEDDIIEAEERRKKEKAYNDQLLVAEALFKDKSYEEAQDAYEKALEILPKKPFPRDKIVEIEKLIKARDQTKILSKEMEARYLTLITSADACFKNEKYASAKSLYKRAGLIAPDRPYPQEQIALADEQLVITREKVPFNKVTDQKYNIIIARADNEFMGEDYVRSRATYLSASRVKPDAIYPKRRVLVIDSIVAANRIALANSITGERPKDKQKVKKVPKNKKPVEKPKQTMEEYLIALAEKYDEGITEEIEVSGGKKTTRIIVVKNGIATEYRKEVFSWATYYKKNNETIPKYIFENETKQ